NMLSGRFVVTDIAWAGAELFRFTVAFEQHCELGLPALLGCMHYEAPPDAGLVPDTSDASIQDGAVDHGSDSGIPAEPDGGAAADAGGRDAASEVDHSDGVVDAGADVEGGAESGTDGNVDSTTGSLDSATDAETDGSEDSSISTEGGDAGVD